MTFQYFFFDTYLGYFLQVLPIALLVSTVYGLIRYRKKRALPSREKVFPCVFLCYMTGLICLVLAIDLVGVLWYLLLYRMPAGRDIRLFSGSIDLVPDFFLHLSGENLGNLLMFLPFGLLYPLSKGQTTWKKTLLAGFLSILGIELLQPILGRAFDINDIILNFLGILISASLFFAVKRVYGRFTSNRAQHTP
ncbi:MAG: VanZ family protein [Clostridia bacterium]|nr:VanZ family protein [Clostridia bacterium]